MNTLERRVTKLERPTPEGCQRCAGVLMGVAFDTTAPTDYDDRPGCLTPFPHRCPVCGRKMLKLYGLPSRAVWDEMWAGREGV